MLGTDKSRGYCLEMICADFLAGANLENVDSRAFTIDRAIFQVSPLQRATGLLAARK
jgi:hypothetical protein